MKLSFFEVRDFIQKRYKINIAQAAETTKAILLDKQFNTIQELNSYLGLTEK